MSKNENRRPTLDRDGYDVEFVLHAARTFAAGGEVGHAPRVMGELLDEVERLRTELETR